MIAVGLEDGHQHPNLCRVAILVLGDVASACKERLTEYAKLFIVMLLNNLASEQLPFDLKPQVVETIGDVAMAIGCKFEDYCVPVITYLLQAGSSNPGNNPDQDDMKELNTLRRVVLECFLSIFHALESRSKDLVLRFGDIVTMLEKMFSVYPSK